MLGGLRCCWCGCGCCGKCESPNSDRTLLECGSCICDSAAIAFVGGDCGDSQNVCCPPLLNQHITFLPYDDTLPGYSGTAYCECGSGSGDTDAIDIDLRFKVVGGICYLCLTSAYLGINNECKQITSAGNAISLEWEIPGTLCTDLGGCKVKVTCVCGAPADCSCTENGTVYSMPATLYATISGHPYSFPGPQAADCLDVFDGEVWQLDYHPCWGAWYAEKTYYSQSWEIYYFCLSPGHQTGFRLDVGGVTRAYANTLVSEHCNPYEATFRDGGQNNDQYSDHFGCQGWIEYTVSE